MNDRTSRRDLLKWSATAGAAALVCPAALFAQDKKRIPIGLQLYSVKNVLGKDFEGTLKQVDTIRRTREVREIRDLEQTSAPLPLSRSRRENGISQ